MTEQITILGSTGSVGTQALDVCERQNKSVEAISTGRSFSLAERQARKFGVKFVAAADENAAEELKIRLADTDIKVFSGSEGILQMIDECQSKIVLNAISGFAGLSPTVETIKTGHDLALANKESLVTAGDIVMPMVKQYGVKLLPVDSEHCAIDQCLKGGRQGLSAIILTASGGPFYGYTKEQLEGVTAADALKHPNWSMGRKITIDSATLMNKGFEVIEACHLFEVSEEQIHVVIHRESIIHSAVQFSDGAVIAQLANPDMRLCVSHAINYGTRLDCGLSPIDFTKTKKLTFDLPDYETFPLLRLAFDCYKMGGNMPCVLNAVNEVAVSRFLNGETTMTELFNYVIEKTMTSPFIKEPTLEQIIESDREARKK